MALATQCPHCHTTFRVAHDQLKLRAGLVRCGACKQIFNGIENLLRPEELPGTSTPPATQYTAAEPEPAATPAAPPEETVAEPEAPSEMNPALAHGTREGGNTAPLPADEAVPLAPGQTSADPLLRMTLVDFDHGGREPAATPAAHTQLREQPDALADTIDDLQSKPWRSEQEAAAEESDALDRADAADYEEPAFVTQARRRERIGRMLRLMMGSGSIVLLLALLAQSVVVFRDPLAARFPQARPALAKACAYLDCQVELPAHIDSVSIESSELQALPANGNAFALTLLLRNQDTTAQSWPHIELTLNDGNENAIARRVFTPREYLPAAHDIHAGFAPASEQPVKLFFELAQLKASGYRVYLFYP